MLGNELTQKAFEVTLWEKAHLLMADATRPDAYTQAMMDLGATCCTRHQSQCHACPFNQTCLAYLNNKVNEYPPKKIKKTVPTKHFILYFFRNKKGEIYLEKQPEKGVWGLLYSFPKIEKETSEDDIPYLMMSLKHQLTHFTMAISVLDYTNKKNLSNKSLNGIWCSPKIALTLGLPKPIKDIIQIVYHDLEQS